LELEPGLLEQELGARAEVVGAGAWSLELPELGAVGARKLWLEPERDPRRTQVHIFTFFLVCLFCLFCLFFFVMFLCNCAAVTFFFLLFCYTGAFFLLWSCTFHLPLMELRYSVTQ
jgi:hypothetical protein